MTTQYFFFILCITYSVKWISIKTTFSNAPVLNLVLGRLLSIWVQFLFLINTSLMQVDTIQWELKKYWIGYQALQCLLKTQNSICLVINVLNNNMNLPSVHHQLQVDVTCKAALVSTFYSDTWRKLWHFGKCASLLPHKLSFFPFLLMYKLNKWDTFCK